MMRPVDDLVAVCSHLGVPTGPTVYISEYASILDVSGEARWNYSQMLTMGLEDQSLHNWVILFE